VNLAYRDVRHNLFRFLLTCFGLSLLLGVVLAMIGIYRGIVVDALTVARNHGVDLWVVEAGSRGPFAEASRIPGDAREGIARLAGVVAAGSVTYQTVEAERRGQKVRLYVIGFEPARPGGPARIVAGRTIAQSCFEMVADRRAGLELGDRVRLGRTSFAVVDLTENQVASGGDPVAFITLRDAQKLQFELAPPAARIQLARGAQGASTDTVNAVVARVAPEANLESVAEAARRWKHLADAVRAGTHPRRIPRGSRATADRHVHEHPAAGVRSHHRPHHLHHDHGEAAPDCHAQADRRAGPHHRRHDRAAGAGAGFDRICLRRTADRQHQGLLSPPRRAGA
jgi:putative ABC transport system permease protein